jgi:5-methyltetrahydrofolate--homocysteine methyltransferase
VCSSDLFASSGVKTSIGLSNISFGLPQRKFVNNAFLNMAIAEGLSAAIVNPSAARITGDAPEEERYAVDFLEGRDEKAARYIQHFAGAPSTAPVAKAETGAAGVESIYRMVLEGRGDVIEEEVRQALQSFAPEAVMNDGLLKALERVGELYSTGEYFLPQMIASAEAMKAGFAVLKPLLKKESVRKAGKLVICTVRGDVHDIGKNIVAMMMENYGFEVLDLGKDVPADEIIRAAKEHGVDIVALSSLLTTTMGEMKTVRDMMKTDLPGVGLLVGGAVVTPEYAESLGAGYGADAVEGVKAALRYMEGK